MKTTWCIIRDLAVIALAFLAVYALTHKEEIVRVSVNAYIDMNGGITELTMNRYFKVHNIEPDEVENNN